MSKTYVCVYLEQEKQLPDPQQDAQGFAQEMCNQGKCGRS